MWRKNSYRSSDTKETAIWICALCSTSSLKKPYSQGETSYISKVAKTEKEICSLVEAGFEYVTEFEGSKIFNKGKWNIKN